MSKKYLLLTASYGGGHNSAKDGLKNYLESTGNNVLVFDIVEYIKYSKSTQDFYQIFAERVPIIWEIIFKTFNTRFLNIFLKYSMRLHFSRKFNNLLLDYSPDVIISSYFGYQYLVGDYIEKYGKNFVFGVFITDNFISIPWFYDDKFIDKFFVIDKLTKDTFDNLLPNRKTDIITTFFPIERHYFLDKPLLQNKNIFILLNGFKDKFSINLLDKLLKKDFYQSINIIKGRNKKLYEKLKLKYLDERFNFIEYMDIKSNLKYIDIFITKPGGALVCECMAQDVFVISPFFIKGQEKGNIDLLENYNLGFYSKDVDKILNFLEIEYMKVDINNFKLVKNIDCVKKVVLEINNI